MMGSAPPTMQSAPMNQMGSQPFAGPPGAGSPPNSATGLNYGRPTGAPGGVPGMAAPMMGVQQQAPTPLPNIDPALQCSPRYLKSSVSVFPRTKSLAPSLPLSCVVDPVATPLGAGDEVPEVNFGACGVIRCQDCRTYINPFVKFVESGRRWLCNNCTHVNDVPSAYFCTVDSRGIRNDIAERPELQKGQVEISAPAEYMVRPPQAPVFVFVIDVSHAAVASGMLQVTVEAIKSSLDNLPGSPRTQVAFITFDSTIHYYNLKQTLRAPQMIAVPDIDDVYVPLPDDLLVNLYESRDLVDMLLDSLPDLFGQNDEVECALGAAVQGAFNIMQHIGGKMLVFQTALPGVGLGTLAARDQPKVQRGDKAKTLFEPAQSEGGKFYTKLALVMSKQQTSCNLFVFASQYADLATIGVLAEKTSGEVFYYPNADARVHGEQFAADLRRDLTRQGGFEAVMRIRCSAGFRISRFYGNFLIRGQDLLLLPSVNNDSTLAVDIVHDTQSKDPPPSILYLQSALLYTTQNGERRIRVNTVAFPVASTTKQVVDSVDIDTLCNVIAKHAVSKARTIGLTAAREAVRAQCESIIRETAQGGPAPGAAAPRFGQQAQQQGQRRVPQSLKLLPLYAMALQKTALLCGTQVPTDLRVYLMHRLNIMSVASTRVFIYPRMYALHNMPPEAGLPAPAAQHGEGNAHVKMPVLCNLTNESIRSDGVFLMENGLHIMVWVGRAVAPQTLRDIFGVDHVDEINPMTKVQTTSELGLRVTNIVTAMRDRRSLFLRIVIIKEGDGLEALFQMHLYDDKKNYAGGNLSFREYAAIVERNTSVKVL